MLFLSHENTATADSLLAMVRRSPLQQSLSFITPQWRAEGELAYTAQIGVPLGSDAPPTAKLQVDIEAEFDQLNLAMPEYRLAWRNLTGQQRFSLPYNLEGNAQGLLFGNPVGIRVDYDPQNLMFEVDGRASALDIFRLAGIESLPVLEGEADFTGQLLLAMGTSAPAELMLTTDLGGMAVNLPAQFGKQHSEPAVSAFDLLFADDYQRIDWRRWCECAALGNRARLQWLGNQRTIGRGRFGGLGGQGRRCRRRLAGELADTRPAGW
jgi:uncharacterized protein YhdP